MFLMKSSTSIIRSEGTTTQGQLQLHPFSYVPPETNVIPDIDLKKKNAFQKKKNTVVMLPWELSESPVH